MMRTSRFAVGLLSLVAAMATHAGVANDVPSCYAANKMTVSVPGTDLELFVMVDQTTNFDQNLQNSIRENVGNLIKPGTAFVVSSFSSYAQGRYLDVLSAGTLEEQIPAKIRDDISVKILKNFDACMKGQSDFGRKTAASALNKALSGIASDIAKSDIIAGLQAISARVRSSTAKNKVVFLASDMLENSSITSFYGNHSVRAIDPALEIKKVVGAKMLGDFGGARVFVLGAGLMQENAGGANLKNGIYRDPKTVNLLRDFWDSYFTASNAKLIEFGSPALISPVK